MGDGEGGFDLSQKGNLLEAFAAPFPAGKLGEPFYPSYLPVASCLVRSRCAEVPAAYAGRIEEFDAAQHLQMKMFRAASQPGARLIGTRSTLA